MQGFRLLNLDSGFSLLQAGSLDQEKEAQFRREAACPPTGEIRLPGREQGIRRKLKEAWRKLYTSIRVIPL